MKIFRYPALRALTAGLFWLVIWITAAALIGKEVLLPSPGAVLRRLWELLQTAAFYRTVAFSLCRITLGFLAAAVLGSAAGTVSERSGLFDLLFSPVMAVIRSTPVASFIILALVWLNRQIIPGFICFLMAFPMFYSNIRAGIRSASDKLLEMALLFRVSKAKTVRRIYIPAVKPYLLAAVRAALGMAWKAGVAAEVLCTPADSIGKMLYQSKVYLETADVFAWTLTVILISVLLEKLILRLLSDDGKGKEVRGE